MKYSWIRVGDPALSKLSRGVWGGLFILLPLCLLVCYLLVCCLVSGRLHIRRCVYTYKPVCMYLHGLDIAYVCM